MVIYYIEKNGKFLSDMMPRYQFNQSNPDPDKCFWYKTIEVATNICNQLNANLYQVDLNEGANENN